MHRVVIITLACAILAISAAGAHATWPPDGQFISTEVGHQEYPTATADGTGGTIVAWRDSRSGTRHIYAQRLDAQGNVLWAVDGVPVCTAAGNQGVSDSRGIDVVADGAGGAYIVWDDSRGASDDIYMQRLDANGNAMWTANGVVVCNASSDQNAPRMARRSGSGVTVVWEDQRNGLRDIYAQNINSSGNPVWTANGTPVCEAANSQGNIDVIFDGAFGHIVVWDDYRTTARDIYVQHLNSGGGKSWTTDGEFVLQGDGNLPSVLVADDAGGAHVITLVEGGNDAVYYARVDAGGSVVDDFFFLPVGSLGSFDATTDGSGGVIIGTNRATDVWFHRVTASGSRPWGDGEVISLTSTSTWGIALVPDGAGGAYAVWTDDRSAVSLPYGQRLDQNGASLWNASGVLVSSRGASGFSSLVFDGVAPAYFFESIYNLPDYNVYGQRLDPRYGAWGHPEPLITAVDDVPGDQGGFVQVDWLASDHDQLGVFGIDYYSVWRALSPILAGNAFATGVPLVAANDVPKEFPGPAIMMSGGFYFEWVANQDAFQLPGYGYTAPTLNSSTTHYFQVIAHDVGEAFVSQPDSGAAVDNLAPAAASLLTALRIESDLVLLNWNAGGEDEPDFAGYAVYRSATTGGPYNLLGVYPDTTVTDSTATFANDYYYVVTATDINGTESNPTNEAMVSGTVTGIGDPVPDISGLQLRQNVPNPFSATTRFDILLDEGASATLEIFDVAGRLVSRRDLGRLPAGTSFVQFDGRSDGGKFLPSGVYFCRVTTPRNVQTRKMVIGR